MTAQGAYGLAVSGLVLGLLLLGWILRVVLRHLGIECRAPVRRGEGAEPGDVEDPQPRTEETRLKERVCTEVNLIDRNNTKKRRPLKSLFIYIIE